MDWIAKFVSSQKPLPPEFARVLYDNPWDLYSRSETPPNLPQESVGPLGLEPRTKGL